MRINVIPIKNTSPKNRLNDVEGEPSLVDSVNSLEVELERVECGEVELEIFVLGDVVSDGVVLGEFELGVVELEGVVEPELLD